MLSFIRPCARVNASFGLTTRLYSTPTGSRPLIGRYDHVPVQLARVQSGTKVSLRDYEIQRKLKRFSYDLKLVDGKVMPANGPNFIGEYTILHAFESDIDSSSRSKWMFLA